MGVGYQVSPLHSMTYLEISEKPEPTESPLPPDIQGLIAAGVARWDSRPARLASPGKAEIVAWRDRIAQRYLGQLGEELSWDEDSDFVRSEDISTHSDLLFRYVAAVLDQRGPAEASILLRRAGEPSHSVLEVSYDRGFACRFPQLLLGANCWFPFKRNIIIEEPTWRGDRGRYGSLLCLRDEVEEIRAFIRVADPDAALAPAPDRPQALASAWAGGETLSRLCDAAVAQHLPLWTTG